MKKFVILILILFVFCPTSIKATSFSITTAQTTTNNVSDEEIVEELEENVNSQLENLDFSSLDEVLKSFTNGQISIFGGKSFLDKVSALISGQYDDSKPLWESIIDLFLNNILSLIPVLSLIIGVSILASMLQGIKPTTNGKSISNVINFVSYGVIIVLILSMLTKMLFETTNTILSIKSQMDAIFPILLTLLTAVGGSVSATIYQPAMVLLTNVISAFVTYVLMPIFIFSIVFSIISNLSSTVKLDKFSSFLNSSYKWLMGLVFTIFTAFLSLQGISASSVDGISIRTAKYAIKSYVPILGSYLSDGMGIILASSNLIKNAVGAAGLFLLLATIISPLLDLIVFMLALKLVAGIVEPLGNKQIANFVYSISKSLTLLISLIIALSFVYFIMIGLVMCSANIF